MLKSKKHVFWEALLVTILIFGIGILFGIYIEGKRVDEISDFYLVSEINLLDIKIQTELLNLENLDCGEAVRKNIEFADKVYEDARVLDDYEEANTLKESLVNHHKRYDLLRTLLWLNSIKIKEKCGEESFHTVVYLYDYQSENLEQKSRQIVFANFLADLKEKKKDEFILIPIARNLDIGSLELLTKNYNINATSIMVDESLIVTELGNLDLIRKYLD